MNKYSLNPSEQKTWQKMILIMGSNRGRNNGASKKALKAAVVAFERAVLLEEQHQMLVDKAEAKCEATEREMHSTKSLFMLAKCEYEAAQHKSVQANALFMLAKDEYAAAQHKAEQANVVELNAKFILDTANDRAVSAKSAYAISQSDYESSKFDQHLDLFAEPSFYTQD